MINMIVTRVKINQILLTVVLVIVMAFLYYAILIDTETERIRGSVFEKKVDNSDVALNVVLRAIGSIVLISAIIIFEGRTKTILAVVAITWFFGLLVHLMLSIWLSEIKSLVI